MGGVLDVLDQHFTQTGHGSRRLGEQVVAARVLRDQEGSRVGKGYDTR